MNIKQKITTLTMTGSLLSAGVLTATRQDHVFVFDMGDTLFRTSGFRVARQLGLRKIIGVKREAEIKFRALSSHLRTRAFAILDMFGEQEPIDGLVATQGGEVLPQIMIDWFCGTQRGKDIVEKIKERMNELDQQGWFTSDRERRVIKRMLKSIFDPHRHIEHVKPLRQGIKLLKSVKKKGYKTYILSNWAPDLFALLVQKYPKIFQKYVDGVIISGDPSVQCVKPHARIYQALFERFNLKPEQCIFIDDCPDNIMAARQFGMRGIICRDSDYSHVKKVLHYLEVPGF